MKRVAIRILLVGLAAYLGPACGGGGGGGGGITSKTGGGAASGPAALAFGGGGSDVEFHAQGPITFGENSAPTKSATPAAPAAATEITDLSVDAVLGGSGQITSNITASGGATRTITVGGDLRITATLFSGQNAGTQINLIINALSGTVYITGKINGTSQDGVLDGDTGGSITINANQIVLRGRIESKGERNTAGGGGDGGAVLLDTVAGNAGTDILIHGGTIDTTGGNGTTFGGDGGSIALDAEDDIEVFSGLIANGGHVVNGTTALVVAGSGGDIDLTAVDDVSMKSTVESAGGDAETSGDGATAGSGGGFSVQNSGVSSGNAAIFGTQDLSGGRATAKNSAVNNVTGGDGGQFRIGSSTAAGPAMIDLPTAELDMTGGDSSGLAGDGAGSANIRTSTGGIIFNGFADISAGSGPRGGGNSSADLTLDADVGDVELNGAFRGNGGSGSVSPGSGEQFAFTANAGNMTVRADMSANGGNASGAVTLDGADADDGGTNFTFTSGGSANTLSFTSGSSITANGGRGASDGDGGGGGAVSVSGEANVVMNGKTVLNGGNGDGLGFGGDGGTVTVNSDSNADGVAGDITLDGSITANGGSGDTGGDGGFVSFDADGNGSNSAANNGIVQNTGSITLRGGSADGNGGDVMFDGLQPTGPVAPPLPGTQNLSGDGLGVDGAYTGT